MAGTTPVSPADASRWAGGLSQRVRHAPAAEVDERHHHPEASAGAGAERAEFASHYRRLAPKAVERLADDWERLVTFYQFPREHWPHWRTSNVVESPVAPVGLRTTAATRFKKVENATAVIWKMLRVAESTFWRLKGAELLPAVYAGAQYVDGVPRSTSRQQRIAA